MSTSSVTIAAGGYTAEIALRGGQLLRLTSQDPTTGSAQNLVVPATAAPGGFAGAVLAPWPNRVAKAAYVFGDTEYSLPVNEEETCAALHGLLYDVELSVDAQRSSEVRLTGVIEATEGYPFRLETVLVYRVAADLGLSVSLMVRYAPQDDDAAGSAPFGAGFHPYLTAGDAPLKDCRLRLPATTVAKTKPSGKVVDRGPVAGDLDLTNGPLLVSRQIDHAFTGLPDGAWFAELLHGPSGLLVRMIADTPWAQVYTGERIDRAGVAVEPMTCPPNAFNSGEDLLELAAGEWFRVGLSIEAIRL